MRPPVKHPERLAAGRQTFQTRQPFVAPSGMPRVEDLRPLPVSDNWQSEAYLFTYAVPEVRYVLSTKASLLSQTLMRVEQRVPGTDRWIPTQDRRALTVLRALQPEIGDQANLVGQASVHAEVAGAAWFYGDPVRDPAGRVSAFEWSFLSTSALHVERKGNTKLMTWGKGASASKPPPDGHATYALLTPDWQYPDRPASTVFSVLPLMKTLVLCRQLLDSMARRQTNADAFFAPQELSHGPMNEWDNPGTPGEGEDEFETELHEYTGHAAADQTSPNRLNPLLMRGPGLLKHGDKAWPMKDLVGLIPLAKDFEGYLAAERAELLEAIAHGLDIEPEIMSGTARVNQWGAYMISEAFVQRHVIPLGKWIVAWLTAKYLRPMMAAFYRMPRSEAAQFRIALDPSPILGDPDLSKVATTGYELDIVSEDAWVRHAGLDEADIADPDEVFGRFVKRLVLNFPELGPALLPAAFPDRDVSAIVSAWPTDVRGAGDTTEPAVDVDGGSRRPGQRPERNEPGGRPASAGQALRIAVAIADDEVRRALTAAGNRLIGNMASRDPVAADRLRAVDPQQVLTAAGASLVRRVGLTMDMLVGSTFDGFEARMAGWLASEVIDDSDPNERRRRAAVAAGELAAQLRLLVTGAASRPLTPGPNGMLVPDEVVRSALDAADLVPA